MAPGLHRLFKREAAAGEEEMEEQSAETTLATHIFGKHLHKVRITTPTTTTEGEGRHKIILLWRISYENT